MNSIVTSLTGLRVTSIEDGCVPRACRLTGPTPRSQRHVPGAQFEVRVAYEPGTLKLLGAVV